MNDDVRKYIEDFRLFDDAEDKVSLRALGSHLSGLGRDSIIPLSLRVPEIDSLGK